MSFENILPIICFFAPIVLGILLWYERFQNQNIQRRAQEERWIQEERRKFKYEEAPQTYKELKVVMGEEIDKILDGQDSDSIVEILNYVGRAMSLAGCSMDQATNALRDLALSLEDYTETPKQKEPQVIFEPKVMIMETSDKKFIYPVENKPFKIIQDNVKVDYDNNNNEFIITKNMADDWYDNFMKEIEQ